ncbi:MULTISPECIES: polysaccharide deacetylase family protein [unclassified Streptomyces]|uniref:polysaccharide deacetylase family protein n=2 Tax=unclassified Streptomyces TaxID=2593676 RepID=UPI000DC30AD9|nr:MULTISPECIES: polysaccharide deacetylase family protein [unclassified Streptomyces]RAJ73850.1 polysaccharide deacetylase [Streptomyces sp. PsTaAH-137]
MTVETALKDTPGLRSRELLPGRSPWVAMYHSVDDCSDDPYNVTVTPDRLQQQLRWLRSRGLRGVSVAELLRARARGAGRGLVGLTFDDGYGDFVENALPLLRHYECTATVFVLAGRLGGENAWDTEGPRKPLLTPQGIRKAAAAGMEIGSHGLMHVDLTHADEDQRRAEVQRSKAQIEEITGAEVLGFCYPYGYVDSATVEAVRRAGYRYGCAISPGPLTSVHAMPRVYVGQRDTPWRLELKRRAHRVLRRPWQVGECAR